MGSGLSMTSVNKIKELATAREYSLALEIIDSQDLSKSLNPQFIRLCGDVYIANGRYVDARKVLLMAHKMAPEAKRVIYSLVELYLKMGYKNLADFYYKLYMFDAEANMPQTNQLKYIYDKAQGCPLQEIETLLFPMYSDVMDYDWSYELYLLMRMQGKKDLATSIKNDYLATYKVEPNAAIIEELEISNERLEELFYSYSRESVQDDDPEQDDLRREEQVLLEADELRMNPKEAEIQILFDDNEKVSLGAKLKYRKHLKEQEKIARKAEKEGGLEDNSNFDGTPLDDVASQNSSEHVDITVAQDDEKSNEADANDNKVGIFKKIFAKKKAADDSVVSDASLNESVEESIAESVEIETEESIVESVEIETEEPIVESVEMETEEPIAESVEMETEEPIAESVEMETEETIAESVEMETEEPIVESVEMETEEPIVESVEMETEEPIVESVEMETEEPIVESVEIETEELKEFNSDNANDVCLEDDLEDDLEDALEDETETVVDEHLGNVGDSVMREIYEKKKISIVTELGEDTFINTQDLDFDNVNDNPFSRLLNRDKKESTETIDEEKKSSFEYEEAQLDPEDDFEFDVDDFSKPINLSGFEDEFEDEFEEIEEEPSYQESEEVEEEPLYQESEEVEEEPSYQESEEVEEEPLYHEIIEDELIWRESCEVVEEHICTEELTQTGASDLINESVYDSLKGKNTLEFPEFKSSLFPEIDQKIVEVNNNFDEIMTEAQDKINENLLKEEQMQREAEALLASLGIDLGVVLTTNNAVVNSQVVITDVEDEIPDGIDESVQYFSPSRDELKSSLKIDSVKKNILKQIKEYR